MADGISVKFKGAEELKKRLENLAYATRKEGGRFALRKGAAIVQKAAIERARQIDDSRTPEEIAKNIVIRWNGRLNKRTGDLGFRVGVLGGARKQESAKTARRRARLGQTSLADLGEISGAGKGNPGGDTFYWRFLEFGTQKMSAKPFMRDALGNNLDAVANEFVKQYNLKLDRLIKAGKI